MTMKRLKVEFSRLDERRDAVSRQESWVQRIVGDFIRQQPGSLHDASRRMGLSVAYLSDIINGRRKISKGVMQALEKLQ
jgi:hypothetical protein